MCLTIKKDQKPELAKSDITCYKIVCERNKLAQKIDKDQPKYRTLYQQQYVEIGSTYYSKLTVDVNECDCVEVERGLHSITNLKDVRKLRTSEKSSFSDMVIVKCTIPKGSNYYVGRFGNCNEYKSYASDCVVYNEIIK